MVGRGNQPHEDKLEEVLEDLRRKGFRTINLYGRSPDGIAWKDGRITAVEIQRLEQQIQNLQSQFSNTDKFLQRNLPAYIEWKRKHP